MTRRVVIPILLLVTVIAPAVHAQSAAIRREVFVNSEAERYLRTLQVAGQVPLYPWSSRGFSPAEVDSLRPKTSHPWAARHDFTPQPSRRLRAGLIAPRVELIYNTAFPYGRNDGAVWAGRGLTAVVHAGTQVRYGPVSLVVAPVAFRAENRAFELAPTGASERPLVYAHPHRPETIDLPQQFGDAPYARIDPGQSTLRLDLPFLALGLSTANLHWGPAADQPLLLGSNAPGFLHAFAGTASPVGVGIGRLHGRILWGRLEQSDYTVNPDSMAVRFATGMIAVLQPRGLPGIELGFGRFFHMRWGDAAPARVIGSLLKRNLADPETGSDGGDADNQLGSVFLRWVLPSAGLELYGEYGREDHNWNFRDAILEPDHSAAYLAGFRKTWTTSNGRIAAVRAELANAEPSHLRHVRSQQIWYAHGGTRQGHTHRGQVLGGTGMIGGRGSTLAADLFHRRGRWTIAWHRELRWTGVAYRDAGDVRGPDVTHEIGLDAIHAMRLLEFTVGLTAARNLNRDRVADATNLRFVTAFRANH